MDQPDQWTFDASSERSCVERWLASGHDPADEQRVWDCLAEIRLAPLERGRPQLTAPYPPDDEPLDMIVYIARVMAANIGVIYVLDFPARSVTFVEIGQA